MKSKKKMAEALKNNKTDKLLSVENWLGQWKNILIGILQQMESALKVTEVYTCKNKYTHTKK